MRVWLCLMTLVPPPPLPSLYPFRERVGVVELNVLYVGVGLYGDGGKGRGGRPHPLYEITPKPLFGHPCM